MRLLTVLALVMASLSSGGSTQGLRWHQQWDGGLTIDISHDVAVSSDGSRAYVIGDSTSNDGADYITIAYDGSGGSELWSARYTGLGGNDSGLAVALSPDGQRVFVTGLSQGAGSLYDFATVSYDAATGTQLWVARYDSPSHGDESATSIDVSPDGTQVYVTGCASPQQYCVGGDYLTVAYRTADGTEVWTSRYSATAQSQDTPTKVVAGPDGSAVYVTGVSDGFGTDDDFVTLAYDAASGSQLWLARYNGPANGGDQPADVSISPDGTRIFVTGCTGDQYCTGHYATVGYDAATGGEIWSAADLRGYHPGSLAVSPDGTRVFVTGYGYGEGVGTWDYVTVAHDAATGETIWTSTYDGGVRLHDFGRVVTVDPDGDRVYVTGESDSPNTFMGWATLAYDPTTGEQLWIARFARGSAPFAMQMSANGSSLFITGYMEGGRTLYDFATLSYSA